MTIPRPALDRRARPQILFVHEDFPGQFGGFAVWLARAGWQVWAAARGRAASVTAEGIRIIGYAPHRPPSAATHPYAQPFDRAALVGQACIRACLAARADGLAPDLIVSHAGPGAGLFLGDAFPGAVQVAYCEWWYNFQGVDTAYLARLAGLPGLPVVAEPEAAILERVRNQPIAAELLAAGRGLCPTTFQAEQFPPALRALLSVRHDGVDCVRFRPGKPGAARHPALAGLAPDRPVVSYATRGMEPHRGFPQVMEALASVQAAHPEAVAVVAGDNRVHYGGTAARRRDWMADAMRRFDLDPARTHFTGTLGADDYLWLLRRTDAHVYATVPFVLSWSMLDAMAAGAPLVLSDTAPVREVADESCARLADLARPASFAEAVADVLADPQAAAARAAQARERVRDGYDAARLHPERAAWLAGLLPAGSA